MDLISRDDAIDTILYLTNCSTVGELHDYVREHNLSEKWSGGVLDAINAIDDVDAQPEIIRCKDCEWSDPINDVYWCRRFLFQHLSDEFCSCAERREDGSDKQG